METKKRAKEKGVKRMKVVAVASNETAIGFYKKNGFADFDVVLEMNVE